jgi:hypothetical protein
METKNLIDKYSDLRFGTEALTMEKQALIDTILTPEIKEKLAEIEAEFEPKIDEVNAQITELDTAIRQAIVLEGETVRGDFHMAVFNKGRVSWDTRLLDGYAKAHPEIAEFRKEGAPSVTIRAVGK